MRHDEKVRRFLDRQIMSDLAFRVVSALLVTLMASAAAVIFFMAGITERADLVGAVGWGLVTALGWFQTVRACRDWRRCRAHLPREKEGLVDDLSGEKSGPPTGKGRGST